MRDISSVQVPVRDPDDERSARHAMGYWVLVELRVITAWATTGRSAALYVEADARRLLG
jgi:hypothetical protein